MLAAHAQLAREGGVPEDGIVLAENGSVVELRDGVPRIVDEVEAGMTFVDGLGVGDVHDVALRDRRKLVGGRRPHRRGDARGAGRRRADGAAGADRARLRRAGASRCSTSCGRRRRVCSAELLGDDVTEIKLLQEHLHDALGGIVYDRTRRRPMMLPVIVEV